MTDTNAPAETFIQRQHRLRAESALAEQDAIDARDAHLAGFLRVERYQIRRIIDLTGDTNHDATTGAYVIEYRFDRRDQNSDYYFAAIVLGAHVGRANFHTRAVATLHALAHLDGDSDNDHYASAAPFAARVLGIPADTTGRE